MAAVSFAVLAIACEKSERSVTSETAVPNTEETTAPMAHAEAQSPMGALKRIDPASVCMVNNHYMGRPQIPVVVEGKTYYGCCEMCKGRLATDPASRTAIDPVSQREVDKSGAVIGKDESGAVVYFETEENLLAYSRTERSM